MKHAVCAFLDKHDFCAYIFLKMSLIKLLEIAEKLLQLSPPLNVIFHMPYITKFNLIATKLNILS